MQRALLLALVVPLLLGACRSSPAAPTDAEAADVRAALEARLLGMNLSHRWVVCVRTKRSFDGSPIYRCNVNFGEPHIVRYCATLADGQLTTNREEPEMRCGRLSAAETAVGS
jgi:hypothetical protein